MVRSGRALCEVRLCPDNWEMPGVYCVLTVGRSHQAGPSLRLSITSDREGSSLIAGREAGVLRMERGRQGLAQLDEQEEGDVVCWLAVAVAGTEAAYWSEMQQGVKWGELLGAGQIIRSIQGHVKLSSLMVCSSYWLRGWRVAGVLGLHWDNIVDVVPPLYCHNLTSLREILILLRETTGNSLMEMQMVSLVTVTRLHWLCNAIRLRTLVHIIQSIGQDRWSSVQTISVLAVYCVTVLTKHSSHFQFCLTASWSEIVIVTSRCQNNFNIKNYCCNENTERLGDWRVNMRYVKLNKL